MKSETQRDRVLEYLLDGGILTDYTGVKIGVGAVRSRVSELIRLGYPIKKGWKVTHNQYGTSRVRDLLHGGGQWLKDECFQRK